MSMHEDSTECDTQKKNIYAVKIFVSPSVENVGISYPIQWYGYCPDASTNEPREFISEHFIRQY